MSEQRRFFNRTNLYIKSGVLRQEQVELAFAALHEQLRKAFPDDAEYKKANYEVNVVCDAKGNLFNFTHAWVSSEKIYNILIGLNPDGTELVERYPDPNWVPPPVPVYVPPVKGSSNWADLTEEEEYEEEQERIRRGEAPTPKPVPQAPMLERKLDPIARLPLVRYAKDQQLAVTRKTREVDLGPFVQIAGKFADMDTEGMSTQDLEAFVVKDLSTGRTAKPADVAAEAKKIVNALVQIRIMRILFVEEERALNAEFEIADYQGKELKKEDQIRILELQQIVDAFAVRQKEYATILKPVDRFGGFEVIRSFVETPPEEDDPRTLCCRIAPHWITEAILRPYFEKFNTDTRIHRKKVNNKLVDIRYPTIRVTDNFNKKDFNGNPQKMVYITYSDHPDHISDAAFALQMRRKFMVVTEDGKSAQLILGHWRFSQAQSEQGERRTYPRNAPPRPQSSRGHAPSARPQGQRPPTARPAGPAPSARPAGPSAAAPSGGRTWRSVAAAQK